MNDFFTFNGVPFLAVLASSGETPSWEPKVEATDHALIGTDRFERSVRSQQYTMTLDAWVEPTEDPAIAQAAWQTLQAAYGAGTLAALVWPSGTTNQAVIMECGLRPLRGGWDGYRGKLVLGLPGGREA